MQDVMIAINCGTCGAQLPADTGICRRCQATTGQLPAPGPAAPDRAGPPDSFAGQASWQPAPLPYGLTGLSAWVYALQAAFVITLLASIAVTGPAVALAAIEITGALIALAGVPVILVWLADGGDTHSRFFPPGARGGTVICGQQAPTADAEIDCLWADRGTIGEVLYRHGLAAGLAGAAALTAQIRAVVAHDAAPAGKDASPATAALDGMGGARVTCPAGPL